MDDDPITTLTEAPAVVPSAPADRAAEWSAAARFVEAMNEACDQKPCEACTTRGDVASELRRVAAEVTP